MQNIHQKRLSKSDTPTTQATSFSRSTPSNLQRSHPPHHKYLHPKKLHIYGCGDSHIRIRKSVSSPPQ